MSTIDRLKKAEENRLKQIELRKEKIEELKKIGDKIFGTREGKTFLKEMNLFCKIGAVNTVEFNPQVLAYEKGLRNVYLTFFQNLLNKDILNDIERIKDE